MKDTYRTISGLSIGEFKDRGSKFIAYAYPIYSDEEFQQSLEEVRKAHPKARHYCYAWRLGLDGNQFRANDDGEPSGTAGRPILGQIDSFDFTNIVIIVVRYFGGTLLGTSGLINAYKLSAADALEQSEVLEKTIEDVYRFTFDYAIMSDVMNAVKKLELEMVQQDFGNIGRLDVAIRQSEIEATLVKLKALIAKVSVEEAMGLQQIGGLKIGYIKTIG